jgi:copper chaperone
MKHKYQIDGISCGGCMARVKKTLEAHPSIKKTEIFLQPKGATIISMKVELSIEDLQKQLNQLEGYTISEVI